MQLVAVDSDSLPLPRILVADYKFGSGDLLLYRKNRSKMAAAFAALKAFKYQNNLSRSRR